MTSKTTWAVAVLAFLAVGQASLAQRAEGFGRDVPLALAVRQIVPNDYLVRFEGSVDQSAIVSWSGADEWQVVLGRLVSARGASFRLDGQTVLIAASSGSTVNPPANHVSSPPSVPASQTSESGRASERSPVVQAPAVRAQVAQPAATPPPSPAEVRTGGLVIRPSRVEAAPPPVVPQVAPVPVRDVSAGSGGVSNQARLPGAPPAPVSTQALPPATQGAGGGAAVSPPVGSNPSAQAGHAPSARIESGVGAASNAAVGGPASAPDSRSAQSQRQQSARAEDRQAVRPPSSNGPSGWRAARGETLNNVLSDWADKAGWSVVFRSRVVYELQAGAQFEGDFMEAATALLKSVQANPAPNATFYRGNRVLVISDGLN